MQTIIFTALITMGLCFAGFVTYGQTFSEWWQQGKTGIKYLHHQIAALEELKSLLRAGYEAAEEGQDSIEAISVEELLIDKQFMEGLKLVKPALKDSAELMSSYALAAVLAQRVNECLDNYVRQNVFTEEYIEWLGNFLHDIVRQVRDDLHELEDLTTDKVTDMKDDERRLAIKMAAWDIRDTYENGMTFLEQLNEMFHMAKQQKINEKYLKKLL